MSIQTVHLAQTLFKVPEVVHAVQNDTGRQLRMIIDDEPLASGDTAVLEFTRPDKSYYSASATLELATNSFIANVTQALTRAGNAYCQLKVTRSGAVVGTFAFYIHVQQDAYGVPSSQEGMTIYEAVERAEAAAETAEESAPFIAEYGVTSAADIYEAYSSGRPIFCKDSTIDGDVYGTLSYFMGDIDSLFAIVFTAVVAMSDDTFSIYTLAVDDGGWSKASRDVPMISRTAVQGGTQKSLVTTGEKYTWNHAAESIPTTSDIQDIVSDFIIFGNDGIITIGF